MPILVILGPTASGKSELALRVAEQIGGAILSVDSMQVYRGMDIGTAKPTPQEQARVKHHLIDLVDPSEEFTVARFVEMADSVIDDAKSRRVKLIASGGTPLYYKALFEGMFEGPGADQSVRSRLREHGNAELHKRLADVDPRDRKGLSFDKAKIEIAMMADVAEIDRLQDILKARRRINRLAERVRHFELQSMRESLLHGRLQ